MIMAPQSLQVLENVRVSAARIESFVLLPSRPAAVHKNPPSSGRNVCEFSSRSLLLIRK